MTLREITATYSVPERVTRMVRGVRSMRTEAGRVDLLFREKAMGTFGRGQRLGDLRRLVRQYNRTAAQVFPTGQHYKGGQYGSAVHFEIPSDEDNNPSFTECIDRNA